MLLTNQLGLIFVVEPNCNFQFDKAVKLVFSVWQSGFQMSIEEKKNNTKVVTPTNQNWSKHLEEPIPSNYL